MNKFSSPDYKRSRFGYISTCLFRHLTSIMVSDAFLASLLAELGISDYMIGIISSFITLAFLFQLTTVFFLHKVRNVKRTVITFYCLAQVMFTCLFLIPVLKTGSLVNTVLVVLFILLGYALDYSVLSVHLKWGLSFVDEGHRGRFSATNEMVSLLVGVVVTLAAGLIVDWFGARNNTTGGFLFIAACVFGFSLLTGLSLVLMKNEDTSKEDKSHKLDLKDIYQNTLGLKSFRSIILVTVLWNVASYTSVGFMGIYKTKELMISVGIAQIINIAGNLCRFFISRSFGRYTDRHSYLIGIRLGLILAGAAFLLNAFTTPELWWLIIIYTVLHNVAMAGIVANMYNITYDYVKEDYFVYATAIKSCIGGVLGFAASVGAGKLLEAIQNQGNSFLGLPVYGQQVLSFLSFLLVGILLFYIQSVVRKFPTIRKEKTN